MKIVIFCLFLATLASCAETPTEAPELATEKQELRQIAVTAKALGDNTGAANLENQIVALDENEPNSFLNIAKTLQKQHNSAAALKILQIGEKFTPANEDLKLAVAMSYVDNSQSRQAIDKLQEIKTLRSREYYNTLGVANDMIDEHEIAQDAFKAGLKIAPNNEILLNNLGLSYIFSGDYQQGTEILKKLAKLPVAKSKYRQNLALAYGLQGKTDEARKLLLKDMPKKDAEENLKIYQKMRAERE